MVTLFLFIFHLLGIVCVGFIKKIHTETQSFSVFPPCSFCSLLTVC